MPPVMGAGAYMMLELVAAARVDVLDDHEGGDHSRDSVLLFDSCDRVSLLTATRGSGLNAEELANKKLSGFEAIVFFGALGALIGLLLLGFSPFRSVTGSLAVILVLATMRRKLDISSSAGDGLCQFLHRAGVAPDDDVLSGKVPGSCSRSWRVRGSIQEPMRCLRC